MSRITVVTALRQESRAVIASLAGPRRVHSARGFSWTGAAGANDVTVVEGGVGPEAARKVAAVLPANSDIIASIGFAGGLAPGLVPGDLVLPATVLWEEGEIVRRYIVPDVMLDRVSAVLQSELGWHPTGGNLLSSPTVLAAATAKRRAGERHAAIAVEMEAAALAEHAAERGVAFVALRVILDPVDLSLEGLRPGFTVSWAARARLLALPGVWPLLATLRRHVAVAASALTRAARVVLPALRPP
jgi:uridine phosphorylase